MLRWLKDHRYSFTTVTPETHALVLERLGHRPGRTLRDIFGYSRDFSPADVPRALLELMEAADVCELEPTGLLKSKLRVSSIGDALFAHSAFPTLEPSAVFFGPDTYRFVRAALANAPRSWRAVDIGTGSGAGGILLAKQGHAVEVVLADVNERALELAAVNAAANGVSAEIVRSDVLGSVSGRIDLILANPPYLVDAAARTYRDGGGRHGEALSVRICREALERLAGDGGGTLLLYTGVAIVGGEDAFFEQVRPELTRWRARYCYEELDPDVFGSELREPAYADAERIAAVFLRATV